MAEDFYGNDEQRYVQSLIEPFSNECKGVRVPQLNSVETITSTDYQTAAFTITSTGRAMIVINYDAIRISPFIVMRDLINPFTQNTVSLSDVTGENGEILQQRVDIAYQTGL